MIVGYHVIFAMYGFWLPNDPRGSWSDFVGSREVHRYGTATKTTEVDFPTICGRGTWRVSYPVRRSKHVREVQEVRPAV